MVEDQFGGGSRYFKMIVPGSGFEERLKLPPDFCEKVKHGKSERAILESRKGAWEMNLRRDNDDQIIFEDGWPRFVDEHRLSIRDFLMFIHTGNFRFNVVVCDGSGCEKKWLVEHRPKREVEKNPATPFSIHTQNLHFTLEMKPYSATKKAMVYIPLEFVRSNHLEQKNGATLRDPRGRTWPVKLLVSTSHGFRMFMSVGWHDFHASNELEIGDLCVFELNPTSLTSTTILLDVQIFRCKTNG